MKKRKSKKNNIIQSVIAIIITAIVFYIAQNNSYIANLLGLNQGENKAYENLQTATISYESSQLNERVNLEEDKLNILFFYVGQADCTLVKLGDTVMLIDAGNNKDGENISMYIKKLGISKIDYLIGTHADEDHIGGLDDIIKNFDIGQIYIPKVGYAKVNYDNIIKAANEKNVTITNPKRGDKFTIEKATCEIMSALNDEDTSANNSSIVIEMRYKNTSYLFMGDGEREVESGRRWNKVDILKVGHHGSNTSNSESFLKQVSPKYAVIEVGKDNSYNLPNSKAIERIEKVGAKILRTDTNQSSFWMVSDGEEITIKEVMVNLDGMQLQERNS